MEVNNKIRRASVDQYCGAFRNSEFPYLLHYSFQVWQGFINSESFSYNDSLFILITTRKEDFRINSTFRSEFIVYLTLFNGDKSDSSIFRIVIFGYLLFSS